MLNNFDNYLIDHAKVIEKYGRYPHRNKVLNRPESEAEKEYFENLPNWVK